MRRGLAVALIGLVAIAPIFVFSPSLGRPTVAPDEQPAQFLSSHRWRHDAEWFGGFSGIELSADGRIFHAVTDRGHLTRGTIQRAPDGRITQVILDAEKPLTDKDGAVRGFPHNDAEGLALDAQGRLFVSFEFAQRILRYDSWESDAEWPSYTRAWRALGGNQGLELVAVDDRAGLITIPEGIPRHARESLVYRYVAGQKWEQPFTLPVDRHFLPVGGDFGADGRFYLLERAFEWTGFRSRVRRMVVTAQGVEDIEVILETPSWTHGNLEGLAVWTDASGTTRLTMISDNHFLPLLGTQIVEYAVTQ